MSESELAGFVAEAEKASMLQRCEKFVKYAETNSPMVRFLEKSIRDRGCTLPLEGFFSCEVLDAPVLGAFDTQRHKVILNAPHITNQNVASRTMVHESIHAFDHCRVKLDIGSCKHLACSEIRAANLSTDCNFSEETNRGIYKLQGQQKKCVKRRAAISIAPHSACAGLNPEKVVESVFEPCYKDTEPFGGIPT